LSDGTEMFWSLENEQYLGGSELRVPPPRDTVEATELRKLLS
jgi:hypothetical protein